jgi:hypothetical protein
MACYFAIGNSRPLVTQTPLPRVTGMNGQFPGRNLNPLDKQLLLQTDLILIQKSILCPWNSMSPDFRISCPYREIAIDGWELTRNWDLDYQKPDFDFYSERYNNEYGY